MAEMLKLYKAPYLNGILINLLTINPNSESAIVSNIAVRKYVKNVDMNITANIFAKILYEFSPENIFTI